jgi:Fe-Mn family superoxide dismutase
MKNLVNKIESLEEEVKKVEKDFAKKFFINEMKKIGIEKLPYSYGSLKRFIDPETMDVHYNKHYKTYVEKLNLALDKKKFGDLDLEQIVKTISRFSDEVRNNAGGAYNHALFWKMLSPTQQKPGGLVLKRIEKDFGTLAGLKKKFNNVAKDRFGSGWVWLVVTKNNSLKIMSTPNQDNPLMNDVKNGGYPILGLDLWEHAYYLKYKNKKDEYIKNFWDAVNWDFVEKLYKMKVETRIDESIVMEQLMNSSSKDIITEQEAKSQSCSHGEEIKFKQLLFPSSDLKQRSPLYGKFKYEYVQGWMNVLKNAYPENWREKNSLFVGHEAGLYNKQNVRSLLMNLTSSYSAFCIIHKDVNQYLSQNGQTTIEYGNDPSKNLSELRRFFSVLDGIRSIIFNRQTQSNTLKQIGGILKKTDCLGKRNEDAAMKIINQRLGDGACVILAGAGSSADMLSGIDAEVTIDGQKLKGQIKPFQNISASDTHISIQGSSSTKEYNNLDIMIFVNVKSKTVKIFKTKGTRIDKGNFVIPTENEIMTIVGKGDLELIDCNKYLSENTIWE